MTGLPAVAYPSLSSDLPREQNPGDERAVTIGPTFSSVQELQPACLAGGQHQRFVAWPERRGLAAATIVRT